MPNWLCYVLIFVLSCSTIYFGYTSWSKSRRLIRIYLLVGLQAAYVSGVGLVFALQITGLGDKWGLNVQAVIDKSTWITEAGIALTTVMGIRYLYFLEKDQSDFESEKERGRIENESTIMRINSGYQLFEHFKLIVKDNLDEDLDAKVIAENRDIPLEKVSNLIMSMTWYAQNYCPDECDKDIH